jgi:CelD/BcsL family acetyltransferase involved in cellulose biosynthesis
VYFYQSGREPTLERESVGEVLMAIMIRRAIERGYRRFDFLRGDEPYKRHWANAARTMERLIVFRSNVRGRCLRIVDWGRRVRERVRAARVAASAGENGTARADRDGEPRGSRPVRETLETRKPGR